MHEGLAEFLPHVYRFALRLTGDQHQAEDLTQETLLRAWEKRSQLKDERATRVWLFRIANNLWRDGLRRSGSKKDKTQSLTGAIDELVSTSNQRPDNTLEQREELEHVLGLMKSLPTRQRTVLYLIAVEELSLGEASDVLEIDKNAAKVSLSLARKKMREEYSKLS